VINKDDGTGEAQAFAAAAGIPFCAIPANKTFVARARITTSWVGPAAPGPAIRGARGNVAEAPPLRRNRSPGRAPGLFKSEAVGRNVVLEPASHEDMCAARWSRNHTRDRLRHRLTHECNTDHHREAATDRRLGCHAGKDEMRRAACRVRANRWRSTPPTTGRPHDQRKACVPRSARCAWPAMRRTATVLSGRVLRVWLNLHVAFLRCAPHRGYVRSIPKRSSPQAVRGHPRGGVQTRRPALYDASSSSTCACRRLRVPQLLRRRSTGRIIGIDVPDSRATHAEAKDVLAGAMLNMRAPRPSTVRSRHRAAGVALNPP